MNLEAGVLEAEVTPTFMLLRALHLSALLPLLSLPAPECPKGDMKTEKKKEKSN